MTTEVPWQEIYTRFDPVQKLQGETLRYFVPRDPQLLEGIAVDLNFSPGNYQALYVGQRGSGKSSELRYLARRVEGDYLTVLVDVDELTDLFNVNHVEVLYLLGASIYGAAGLAGHQLEERLLEELVSSIETLVREQTERDDFSIDLPAVLAAIASTAAGATVGGAFGGPAGAAVGILAVAETMFKGIKFSLGISDKIVRKLEVKPQISAIVRALNRIIVEAQEATGRPLLVIVDGIDRVEPEQARAVFAESQVLTQPDCHLIYVIPGNLFHSPALSQAKHIFQEVHLLPNIKLHPQGLDEPHQPGYSLMYEVVDLRLHGVGVTRQSLFQAEALDLLIKMSGGLMREFIRLVRGAVRDAVTRQASKIELVSAETAVDGLRRDYLAGINQPRLDELITLLDSNLLSGSPEGAILLQNQYILCQSNQGLWYEIHPALVAFVQAEMSRRLSSGLGV